MTAPTVLVTGASTGIGRATAVLLAQRGFRVLGGVRKDADADALSELGHTSLEPVILDVVDADHRADVAARIDEACPDGLAGLVNNAGVAHGGAMEFVDLDEFRHVMEVNVVGLLGVTQAVLPALRRAKGRIVHIGSTGSRITPAWMGTYCASKHAVAALADAQRQELGRFGIGVVLLEPGAIATPIWDKGSARIEHERAQAAELAEQHALYPDVLHEMDRIVRKQARVGIPPEAVAEVVHTALTARRPRARYPVGNDAHVATFLGRHAPMWLRDALIARFR